MAEISSPKDLEEWLEGKPKECAQVLANRCALRVVPVLEQAIDHSKVSDDVKNQLTLSVVRASLISDVAAYSSTSDISDASRAADAASAAGAADAASAAGAADAALAAGAAYASRAAAGAAYASRAADAAADAAAGAADAADAADAAAGAAGAADAAGAARAAAYAVLSHDVKWLEANGNGLSNLRKFLTLPLWYDQPNPQEKRWQGLKQSLRNFDLNWEFWIDWYQSKLDGALHAGLNQDQQEDLYYKIATFPNKPWEIGAEAVNQRIAELMEEIKKVEGNDREVEIDEPLNLELPPQNKGALQFKTNEDGIIELDKEANENEFLNDQDAIDRHSEVEYLANELISSYDPNLPSANSAKPIVTKVQRYLEALGETPEEANVNFIIPRGEVLRQELKREENRDEFTSSPPLPDNFKSSLASLVRAHNIYVLLDPILDKRDQARLGPDAKENLVSKEEGLKFVEDVFNEGLIEEEIAGAFNEEAETVHETPDPERRQDRRFSESVKNLSRFLLSNTQSIAKKIKEKQADIIEVTLAGAGGATVVSGSAIVVSSNSWAVIAGALGVGASASWVCFKILQNVVKNEDFYLKYFNHSKKMKSFIEALKKLPLK